MKLSKMILGSVLAVAGLTTSAAWAEQTRRAPGRAPAAAAAPAPTPAPAPYAPPVVPTSAVAEAGPRLSSFKWDLYIDLEARLPSRDTLPDRGFTLNDAALYMTHDFGRGIRGLVELPFATEVSTRAPAVPAALMPTFSMNRAQAYVESERSLPLYWRVGQYNSFLGVEANDSRDRFFADLGLIKGLLLPATHTGVQVGYRAQQAAFNGQITDPNGLNTMVATNPEIGLNARFESGQAYGAGGLTVNDDKTVSSGNHTNLILDLTGGWKSDRLKIDGELAWLKQSGSDKDATAFGVFAVYGLDEALSVGGRLEYARDVRIGATAAPAGAFESLLELSAGPSYKLQQDLTVRGDFSLANMKSPTFDDTIYAASASLVASF